jgi:hypothetical protein
MFLNESGKKLVWISPLDFPGPFKVIACRGEVSYQLELPAELSDFHDVFHVSQL